MNVRNLLVAGLISMYGCTSQPFSATIAGQHVQFPINADQLRRKGYALNKWQSQYVDSTESIRVGWLMGDGSVASDSIYGLADHRTAFGVNLYLKHAGDKLDSIRSALEKQFDKQFRPVELVKISSEQLPRPWGERMDINDDIVLFIRPATADQGDHWSADNTVRIALCYKLSTDEEERFALSEQQIKKDD